MTTPARLALLPMVLVLATACRDTACSVSTAEDGTVSISCPSPTNVGLWGWCGGSPFTSGGFVCFQ